MCNATQTNIQFKFYETEFELRSVATYTNDVANVACSDRHLTERHSRGVKEECVLNDEIHTFVDRFIHFSRLLLQCQ